MDKKDFEKTAQRLKEAFETGMTYLKTGAQEAGFVKDKAMEAIKLEMALIKIRNKLEKQYLTLGQEVAVKLLKGRSLTITASLKEKAESIAEGEKEKTDLEKTLKSFSVIRK